MRRFLIVMASGFAIVIGYIWINSSERTTERARYDDVSRSTHAAKADNSVARGPYYSRSEFESMDNEAFDDLESNTVKLFGRSLQVYRQPMTIEYFMRYQLGKINRYHSLLLRRTTDAQRLDSTLVDPATLRAMTGLDTAVARVVRRIRFDHDKMQPNTRYHLSPQLVLEFRQLNRARAKLLETIDP